MFAIKPKHQASLTESICLLIFIIGLISYFIIYLEAVPHIPILLGILILIAYGLVKKIPFKDLGLGSVNGVKHGMGVLFLLYLIGILISSWMISGTIPILISTGFSLVNGTWFYGIVFAITAIIGVSLGSSLTTTATVGVAFMGMATGFDASLAITAGAIVSGAFFGDKMSPLSDTTNLAASIVEVDLFEHIKHMSLTTIPAFIISFILFVLISPQQSVPLLDINEYQTALATTNLVHWTSWLPLIVLICCTIFKVPAFIALACSSLIGSILAKIMNNFSWTEIRTEEHTSELQSRGHLVCRLLLEKQKRFASLLTS